MIEHLITNNERCWKPCPFCGLIALDWRVYVKRRKHLYARECRNCHARGPSLPTQVLAEVAWETRDIPRPRIEPQRGEDYGEACDGF